MPFPKTFFDEEGQESSRDSSASMDNGTFNVSDGQVLSVGRDSALFLIIILITTGVNVLIVAALFADRKTNQSLRVILVSLLLSGVVSITSKNFKKKTTTTITTKKNQKNKKLLNRLCPICVTCSSPLLGLRSLILVRLGLQMLH